MKEAVFIAIAGATPVALIVAGVYAFLTRNYYRTKAPKLLRFPLSRH